MSHFARPPIVQLAIDSMDEDVAASLVTRAAASGADWIELGRPLLDAVGFAGLERLVRLSPNSTFVLDAMILAAPGRYMDRLVELGIAAVTVTALAPEVTIRAAIASAREADRTCIVDLFNCHDPHAAAEVAVDADYLMVHIGIDQRMADPQLDALELVARLSASSAVPLAYACYDADEAFAARQAGASVLVLGEFWTRYDVAELASVVTRLRSS